MRRLLLGLAVSVILAGGAGAQPPQPPAPAPGPFVGDETHREHLEGDIPFPDGVTPPDRPVYKPAPHVRSRHARAAGRRRGRAGAHAGGHGRAKPGRRAGRRRH